MTNKIDSSAKIFVAGSEKSLGKAIVRELNLVGYNNIIGADLTNLTNQQEVFNWFEVHKPDYVIYAAGKSGGIAANQAYPADFILDNVLSCTNVIAAAHQVGVKKLLYLASSCIYPKNCSQPMQEEEIMTGKLEPTNEAYATAKLTGLVMCKAYRSQYGCNFITAIPTNYFSPDDNFDPENSHVIGALISKMHHAKINALSKVELFGTGKPRREFLSVTDIARASIYLLENYDSEEPINIGGGIDISIKDLACLIKEVVGFKGDLFFDISKNDGMLIKVLDANKIKKLGWQAQCDFTKALYEAYKGFLDIKNKNKESSYEL